jgi:hypothetical protein
VLNTCKKGNDGNQAKTKFRRIMEHTISHSFEEETVEAKARWFQSLSTQERMDLLCTYTNLILAADPQIVEKKDARPITDSIHILIKSQG